MRVLVTGGGGYLGCWIIKKLLAKGHAVRLFDRFCFGREVVVPFERAPLFEAVAGDIRRLGDHPGLFDGIDGVIHLASISNAPSCNLDAEMAVEVNVEGAVALARRAKAAGTARFVFASTCSVYGQGVFELLDEESPPNPVSTFGQSKLAAERALLALGGEGFEPVISRAAALFGWSPRMRFDLALNEMTATALRQGRIVVRGGGNQWRPFVHVRDAARAMIAMLEAPADQVAGEVFNTGTDIYNLRIVDLAQRVARHFAGVGVEVSKDEDLRNFRVQFGKIRNRLNFMCQWSIDEGIEEIRKGLEDSGLQPFGSRYHNVDRMKELLQTPAAAGGEPVAARFIPLSRRRLDEEEETSVLQALRGEGLDAASPIGAFEQAVAEIADAPHAIAVHSSAAALHLCLVDLGIGPGDEVITAPIADATAANAILNTGASVVFADVDARSLTLCPAAVEAAITSRTRALVPVHLAGHPCQLDALYALARHRGLAVIEDAGHALGARHHGAAVGSFAGPACFSAAAIKNLPEVEGGAITLKDAGAAERLRQLAAGGFLSAPAGEGWDAAPWPVFTQPGHHCAISVLGAVLCRDQLKRFPAFKVARDRIANLYRQVLADIEEIDLPYVEESVDHAWRFFCIRFKLDKLQKTRDALACDLRRENVEAAVPFPGLHLHPYFQETKKLRPEAFPEATRASRDILAIPMHPQLSDKNMHEVVAALKKVILHAKHG